MMHVFMHNFRIKSNVQRKSNKTRRHVGKGYLKLHNVYGIKKLKHEDFCSHVIY